MSEVRKSWERIDRWFQTNLDQDDYWVASGASKSEIDEAEREFTCGFPPGLRESYSIHNGCKYSRMLYDGYYLMPLQEIVREARRKAEIPEKNWPKAPPHSSGSKNSCGDVEL